jgi:hypothetical protein
MSLSGRRVAAGLSIALALYPRESGADDFLPHAVCYLWDRSLLAVHATADFLIGASYVIISATLAYLVYRARRDIPFHSIVLAFGALSSPVGRRISWSSGRCGNLATGSRVA